MAFSNPVATVSSGLRLVDGVLWGEQWSDGTADDTQIAVYIAGKTAVENFDFGGTTVKARTVAEETAAFRLALDLIDNVCNLQFTEASSRAQADIIVGVVNNATAGGNLGISVPPGEDTGPLSSQQGAVIVNCDAYSAAGYSSLQQGGYDFVTFIHEFGHAIGLKHPHDTGGGVFPPFPGVTQPFDDYGSFNLNQGIYSMMSYNDGFHTGPLGPQSPATTPDFGWEATPMAFDVAALQYMYGVNTTFHTTDDVYTLPTANAAGTFYSCIWDAGGNDTIAAGGNSNVTIDLRAATLQLAVGGGGILSSQTGIFGGFTIANGAVIENALGGGGADTLTGNAIANTLNGQSGADSLSGLAGNDTLLGGAGVDVLIGGLGADMLSGGGASDDFTFQSFRDSRRAVFDHITDFISGLDKIDLRDIDANILTSVNDGFTYIGNAGFSGTGTANSNHAAELRSVINTTTGITTLQGDVNGDGRTDLRVVFDSVVAFVQTDFLL